MNASLSSITLDSLKNYYTFVYHITNDATALQFSGMNYPYGEHIVYTDCQPLLTFILRSLPFTHNYLIGILHGLMYASFILSPLVLFAIFLEFKVDKFSSFFISLAISLLAPQFLKINAGHFALAYGCIFPWSILLLIRYFKSATLFNCLKIFAFNLLLFLLHPYLGFATSMFSFLSLFIYGIINSKNSSFIKTFIQSCYVGLLPPLLFKLFMFITDKHGDRTSEPFGTEVMIENLDSLLAPVFGPFQSFLEYVFPNRTSHFEGHTYLGFFTIVITGTLIVLLPFAFKKIKVKKELIALFYASLFILFFSFGWHLKFFKFLNIESETLNQFRAVCRFAWLFYYTLPLFVSVILYNYIQENSFLLNRLFLVRALAILFFGFNLIEANSYFKLDEFSYWKFRNFFNAKYLNQEEQNNLSLISTHNVQAILPLPIFHGGSEMYDRLGSSNSMLPAMIYSYHANLPILSVMMSRTSQTETKNVIQVLNSYKNEKEILKKCSQADFFVINTSDNKMPDEERLIRDINFSRSNDTLQFGFVSMAELLKKKITSPIVEIKESNFDTPDSNSIVFIKHLNKSPFLEANMLNYEKIYVLDSNLIEAGKYSVSFHYYYRKNTYKALAVNLIIEETRNEKKYWAYVLPIRYLSAFYDGFAVFECKIELSRQSTYEFLLKGELDESYHISHFMLRPFEKTTQYFENLKDTLINNYPN